jgi:hypothetical protein
MRHVRRHGFDGVEKFYRKPGLLRKWGAKAVRELLKAARR